MQIKGPVRYSLNFNAHSFEVTSDNGANTFSGLATSTKPKLYIFSIHEIPIYVGMTKQSIRNRLRMGWVADGRTGYHGYAFRNSVTEANLDIWSHENAPHNESTLDIETVEAEVVFLIRIAGQWPQYQTEIHFHTSDDKHRNAAISILKYYRDFWSSIANKLQTL